MILISANTRQATAEVKELLTSGSVGIQVQFSFSNDWDGLVKTACFRCDDDEDSQIDVALTDTGLCNVPWETVADAERVLFAGVYGTDGFGNVVIPTVWASLGVIKLGVKPSNASGSDPTPDMWAQIQLIAQTAGADNALVSEGYAVGKQNGTDVSSGTYYHNNSKYYSEQASTAKTGAETAESGAEAFALKSEGFAVGEQNGTAVTSGSPYYQNNAEYMKEEAANYASQSDSYAGESAAWATGSYSGDPSGSPVSSDAPQYHNNAYYYAQQAAGSATSAATAQGYAEAAQTAAETAQGKAEDAQEAIENMTATATVDANVGTPSVTVTKTTVDDHENLAFAFSNIKGSKGDTGNTGATGATGPTGPAAGFGTVSATIDGNVGTPAVTVTASGPDTAKQFAFAFSNMKGATGATGDDGITPTVEVTEIAGGHNVAFDYGTGDARNTDFDVMDGEVSEEDLEEALQTKADVIKDTAAGRVVTFPDGADSAPMGISAIFEMYQSGSGDPSPSNKREIIGWPEITLFRTAENLLGGSNLRDGILAAMPSAVDYPNDKYVTFTAGAGTNTAITSYIISHKFKENTQYTFTLTMKKTEGSSVASNLRIYYTDGTYDNIPALSETGVKETVVLVSNVGKTVDRLVKYNSGGTTAVYYDESGIFEGVLTALDFKAYQGAFALKEIAIGKNKFARERANYSAGKYINASGEVTNSGSYKCTFGYTPVIPSTEYTISLNKTTGNNAAVTICEYDENKTFIQRITAISASTSTGAKSGTFTTSATTKFLRMSVPYSSAATGKGSYHVQLELGSEATTYEEFINACSGTVVLHEDGSGEISVETVSYEFVGDAVSDGTYGDDNAPLYHLAVPSYNTLPIKRVSSSGYSGKLTSSYFKRISEGSASRMHDCEIRTQGQTAPQYFYFRWDAKADVDAVNDAFSDTPIQVAAELETPVTVQLPTTVIKTLKGLNNVWCSCIGPATAEYRADTKLYIEKLTQPTEDDMTANTNIASGKFFMVGNNLYYSTASIASGEQIVPGTNCTRLSLADALNNLNT